MNDQIKKYCEELIQNRDTVKTVFSWDGGLMNLCCASLALGSNRMLEEEQLRRSRDLIKQNVGIFSNFRSTSRSTIATMLTLSESPEQVLKDGLQVYELLKNEFWGSQFLPMVAMIIAQSEDSTRFTSIVERTKRIYQLMKSNHPFLTSSEDCAFCALMALSEKSDEQLIDDAENCYQILKRWFFSGNAVQSLSHVLALCDGLSQEKCDRTMELFEKLKEAGHRYGTEYELPTLGVLAMSGISLDQIVAEMSEIDAWLAEQKGFGFFSSVSRKQRLMYAGMIAGQSYANQDAMKMSAVNGTISIILAQEAAMCAAIAASSAAAANASAN